MPRCFLIICALLSSPVQAGSLRFLANQANQFDYGQHIVLPGEFGTGEFTLELWVLLDDSFPVGPCSGDQRLTNWCDNDDRPYDNSSWWFDGNWLLDGHNNSGWSRGSFDLQVYGGGRIRWLFGDGVSSVNQGATWAVQAWPASTTPSLLDGLWHRITLVRRWVGASDAQLELWIDGAPIATETTPGRVDMVANYWADWSLFPGDQPGWFWGAEKQVAVSNRSPLEDYKGLLDELQFWNRAKSTAEISEPTPATANPPGLVGYYAFEEGSGTSSCDDLSNGGCIELFRTSSANWSAEQAPISNLEVIFRDGFEQL